MMSTKTATRKSAKSGTKKATGFTDEEKQR
jgi:hypothetical protein